MKRGRRTFQPAFLLLALVALLQAGCSEDEPLRCCPGLPAGRIEGVVRTGGVKTRMTLSAERIHESGQSEFRLEVSDSTGPYKLDVPPGRYRLSLSVPCSNRTYFYGRSGVTDEWEGADTIVIADAGRARIDFTLATLQLSAPLSRALDGKIARIFLYRPGDDYASADGAGVVVDGAAKIVSAGVLPGRYRVEIGLPESDTSSREYFWYPATWDSAESPWIDVPSNRTVRLDAPLYLSTAHIEGQVTGAWLTMDPSNPPSVSLFDPDSNRVVDATAVERSDGRFAFDLHLPVTVKVLIEQDHIKQWYGGRTFRDARAFTLAPGDTISGIRFVQSGILFDLTSPPGSIFVGVFDSSDPSRPLAVWYDWLGESSAPLLTIPNLRAGAYLIQFEPDRPGRVPWFPQWFGGSEDASGATPITVAEGEVVRESLTLERGGEIHGQVLADSLLYYDVVVTPANDSQWWSYSGGSSIDVLGLPNGDWKIGVQWDDPQDHTRRSVWYPSATDWNEAGVIQVRNHESVTGIVIDTRGH